MNESSTETTESSGVSDVTVVIPCFNEEASAVKLCQALSQVEDALTDLKFQFLIVDDGSTDRSTPALRSLISNRRNFGIVEHDRNRGIAAAIMTGLRAATTEVVCSMDFDCSYDPLQLGQILPELRDGIDLVTASPYHPRGKVLNVPAWRLCISRCASGLYRATMRPKLFTYTSCFRAYRRSSLANMELKHNGFVGVAEMLWRLDQQGGKIAEVPAVLDVREFGQSKLRVLRVSLAHVRLLLRICFSRFFPASNVAAQPTAATMARPAHREHCFEPES